MMQMNPAKIARDRLTRLTGHLTATWPTRATDPLFVDALHLLGVMRALGPLDHHNHCLGVIHATPPVQLWRDIHAALGHRIPSHSTMQRRLRRGNYAGANRRIDRPPMRRDESYHARVPGQPRHPRSTLTKRYLRVLAELQANWHEYAMQPLYQDLLILAAYIKALDALHTPASGLTCTQYRCRGSGPCAFTDAVTTCSRTDNIWTVAAPAAWPRAWQASRRAMRGTCTLAPPAHVTPDWPLGKQ